VLYPTAFSTDISTPLP